MRAVPKSGVMRRSPPRFFFGDIEALTENVIEKIKKVCQ